MDPSPSPFPSPSSSPPPDAACELESELDKSGEDAAAGTDATDDDAKHNNASDANKNHVDDVDNANDDDIDNEGNNGSSNDNVYCHQSHQRSTSILGIRCQTRIGSDGDVYFYHLQSADMDAFEEDEPFDDDDLSSIDKSSISTQPDVYQDAKDYEVDWFGE